MKIYTTLGPFLLLQAQKFFVKNLFFYPGCRLFDITEATFVSNFSPSLTGL